jgi:tRNA(Ile)-lysidine synthase
MKLEHYFKDHLASLVPGLVVVGVSGGADSVALLRLLHAAGRKAVVAHLDHSLRETSGQDAWFVQQLAAQLGYACVVQRTDIAAIARSKKQNLEATARTVRYGFLAKVAKAHQASAILVAHTQNDQAETILLQLLRGTGRAKGIRIIRDKIVRPLLAVSRSDLEDYLKALGQVWLEDASNSDVSFDRNYVRHQILPPITERFPQAVSAFSRFAQLAATDDDALEELALNRLLPDTRWPCPAYRMAPLKGALPALKQRALRQILERIGIRPEQRLVGALEDALDGKPCSLPGGWTARSRSGTLFLVPSKPLLPGGWQTPQQGDYIRLKTGRKRLVEFLAERGVPVELKRVWPVQRAAGEITAIWKLFPAPDPYMPMAIKAAKEAFQQGEVPIGAVLVQGNQVWTKRNQSEALGQATAHAELLVLQEAMQEGHPVRQKVLPGSTLYVTLEPCLMCYGAIVEAQVARVVYGAENLKSGAFTVHGIKPACAWEGGWLEKESQALLKAFFASRR